MENDPLCIKEDVCDMAVCDGVSSCSHAVLKTAVLAQQTNNSANTPLFTIDQIIEVLDDSEHLDDARMSFNQRRV